MYEFIVRQQKREKLLHIMCVANSLVLYIDLF